MAVASEGHRMSADRLSVPVAPAAQAREPACSRCGPGFSLIFHGYVPEVHAVDGSGLRPPSVCYSCARCGVTENHPVPFGWAPPEWQWYW